ncbi:MAG: 23S rRNA (uracil(1939)-C(5))-methyltransferase RlmD [Coriobacteriales bacterium]|nr:23S rRNA (uracil(1939)-C(5))-methyltransferase RlmD [Coriobacteriales bacterium]
MLIEDCPETLRIEAMAYQGAGVARHHQGKTVFVEGAVVGDLVRLGPKPSHSAANWERYNRFELLESSPWRLTPSCAWARECVGCPWQVVAYPQQLFWKRCFVVDSLQRIARITEANTLVAECVPSPAQWHYRNKLELAATTRQGQLRLGFRKGASAGTSAGAGAGASADICAIDNCQLFAGKEQLPAAVRGALNYALKGSSEQLVRVALRSSTQSGQLEIALWTLAAGGGRRITARVLADATGASSVVRVLTSSCDARRKVRKLEILAGPGSWQERLGDLDFQVSAPSFFQVNSAGAALLQRNLTTLLRALGIGAGSTVYDLYSGTGVFTLPLAQGQAQVHAVEALGYSLDDLRRNLRLNNLKASVIGGDAAREVKRLPPADLAVIDPPRGGLKPPALAALAAAQPSHIVYVSCNPTTLARDVGKLLPLGYQLISVQPFDLFAQTYHVESMTLLSRS